MYSAANQFLAKGEKSDRKEAFWGNVTMYYRDGNALFGEIV